MQVHMLEHTHTYSFTLRQFNTLSYKQDGVTMSRGLIFYGVKELDTPALILRATMV